MVFLQNNCHIIQVNILLRPSLWTAFNIVGLIINIIIIITIIITIITGLIYLWLTIILGSYKMVQISELVITFLKLESNNGD